MAAVAGAVAPGACGRFGHIAGDEALCFVAHAMRSNLRAPDDALFRYGGEEFVVSLFQQPLLDAGRMDPPRGTA